MPYGWPIEPFGRAHPVRGYFNDPRISGRSRAFHHGIDIACADGTPVYAIEGGTVHRNARRVAVVSPRGRVFGYWHIVPAVRHRQDVRTHQLLGHVEAPWAHVHLRRASRRSTATHSGRTGSRRGSTPRRRGSPGSRSCAQARSEGSLRSTCTATWT